MRMTRNRRFGQWRGRGKCTFWEDVKRASGWQCCSCCSQSWFQRRSLSFHGFLYRGQHLRFGFRKSPNRKWDVAGFGLWGQTHERGKFQQPKSCSSWLRKPGGPAKVIQSSSSCLRWAQVPAATPPITPESVFHKHDPHLDTGALLGLHRQPFSKLEGHSWTVWKTRRKQPLILCGQEGIWFGRSEAGTAVELGFEQSDLSAGSLCDDLGKYLVSVWSEPPDKTCEFSQTFEFPTACLPS